MLWDDGGRKHLNGQEQAAIIAFTEAGKTVADISERLGIGAATVSLWRNQFHETGSIMRKQGWKVKKLTPKNKKDIVLAVSAKPITTAQKIAGKFFDQKSFATFCLHLKSLLDVTAVNFGPLTIMVVLKKTRNSSAESCA